jgi:hypothetical protein
VKISLVDLLFQFETPGFGNGGMRSEESQLLRAILFFELDGDGNFD